jgi:hypothetical protein
VKENEGKRKKDKKFNLAEENKCKRSKDIYVKA